MDEERNRVKDGEREKMSLEETLPAPSEVGSEVSKRLPDLGQKYEVYSELGSGGLGTVLLARQVELNRLVAVKVLHSHVVGPGQEVDERFRREAQVTAGLAHPNIVSVHDFDTTPEGVPFLVMERLEGEDLAATIRRNAPMPPDQVVALLKNVADGLDRAHEVGVTHRDIKPANLFLTEDGIVKILDFGICHLADVSMRLTASAAIVGTPQYMTPEQLVGKEIGPATDQYALALVTYEMLCGRPAFRVKTASEVSQRLTQLPDQVHKVVSGLPAQLGPVIERALSPIPARRFESASTFIHTLERSLSPETNETGWKPPVAARVLSGMRRRRVWPAVVAVLVLAMIMAVGVTWFDLPRWGEDGQLFNGLPETVRVAALPFATRPQRTSDETLWPLCDKVIANELMNQKREGWRVEPVDPLVVQAETQSRKLTPPLDADDIEELAAALEADLIVTGEVQRVGGLVSVAATVRRPGMSGSHEISGEGADLFVATRGVVDSLARAARYQKGPTDEGGLPVRVVESWKALVGDPWTEQRYVRFRKLAADGPPALGRFAKTLAERGEKESCHASAAEVGDTLPHLVGGLAAALCSFRARDTKEALVLGMEAYENPELRRAASRFVAKLQVSGLELAEQLRLARERVELFPDDVSAWWMLATLQARAGEDEALGATLEVATSLARESELTFLELLSAARLAMLTGSLEDAATWVARLDRMTPSTDWELMWRACRKSALLQTRGRYDESQRVLEAARSKLARDPGDPYTIVAIALFYSYLHFGRQEQASEVAAEYLARFPDAKQPDHWVARMLELALEEKAAHFAKAKLLARAEELGDSLVVSAGGLGRKEREAALCLLLSHIDQRDEAARLSLKAHPENTMVAGCRFRHAQVLLEEERYTEAAKEFQRSRKEMLYRGDWYMEYHLPALLGEGQAWERASESEKASAVYDRLLEWYEHADRELKELGLAREARQRLAAP